MTSKKSVRLSQLIAFDNAAAGHEGVMSDLEGTLVVKPCTTDEIDFYETLSAHQSLTRFIPTYIGRLSLGSDDSRAKAPIVLPPETAPETPSADQVADVPIINHAWKNRGGEKLQTEHAIVLENVATGYKKPNILDVKLGARLWADDCRLEKRQKLDKLAAETTSGPLGFRIAGGKVYRGPEALIDGLADTSGYKIFDKHYGRSLTVDNVAMGFQEFFQLGDGTKPTGSIRKVIGRFISNLDDLESLLQAEESRMYSASLLFVYEGDSDVLKASFAEEREQLTRQDEHENIEGHESKDGPAGVSSPADGEFSDETLSHESPPALPNIQALKLIDFAHAKWVEGDGPDENLLDGLRNVTKILTKLLG